MRGEVLVACILALSASFVPACSISKRPNHEVSEPSRLSPVSTTRGLQQVGSQLSSSAAADRLRQALEAAGLLVPLDLDHSAAARNAGLELAAARLFIFGDPAVGTVLMRENPLAALDLPLKMLVWEDAAGAVHVTYDSTEYLRRRHALASVDRELERAAAALANLASAAAGTPVAPGAGDAREVSAQEGLVVVQSRGTARATHAAFVRALESLPALSIFAQIDHQAAAQRAGQSLDFSTLVVFGSAATGTPLMQQAPSIGLDLPLKVLIAERGGAVVIAYNRPSFIAERHGGIGQHADRLQLMTTLLEQLAAAAATP